MELVKAAKALMDGCNAVRERGPLIEPPAEFVSKFLLKNLPVFISVVKADGEVLKFKPDAVGFYLSKVFINEISGGPMTVIVFARGFNTEKLKAELGVLLLFEDEYIICDLVKEFEIDVVFNLLKEHTANGGQEK